MRPPQSSGGVQEAYFLWWVLSGCIHSDLIIGFIFGITFLMAMFLPPLAALVANQTISMYAFQRFFAAMR
jgi:hypothetical protein